MTSRISRRHVIAAALVPPAMTAADAHAVEVPVLRLLDKNIASAATQRQSFHATVWQEAANAFQACGVSLRTTEREGEVRRYPSGRPQFVGLERKMLNVILTGTVPLDWDSGRGLSGVAAIYEGYHVIVIALERATRNRIPFLSLNTVVHEMLHAFRGDVFLRRAGFWKGADREAAVDLEATRLWLFGGSSGVKQSAQNYLQRLLADGKQG